MCEFAEAMRWLSGNLFDRGRDTGGFAAPIVRIVLYESIRLPGKAVVAKTLKGTSVDLNTPRT